MARMVIVALSLVLSLLSIQAIAAGQILQASGVKGGLVVVVGCEDTTLIAELARTDGFLVHALDSDPAKVAKTRKQIAAAGEYGRASVERFRGGRLPYVDNLVNLLVISDSDIPVLGSEIERVLAPRGVALIMPGLQIETRSLKPQSPADLAGWTMLVKPVPSEIDEWTHYLHDPDNNAVSRDRVVAPPRRMQWVAGPRYSRHHDNMSSISAVVTAGGKVFSIIDEGPSWSIVVDPRWALTARDAFNGTLLWKRPIGTWHNHLQRLKSGPASLPRRLVAVGDNVYATIGINAPVEQIDADSGKTIQQYKGTQGTTEILVDGGVLYLVSGSLPPQQTWYAEAPRTLMAVRADTGEILWQENKWVVPGTLTVLQQRVYFFEKDRVSCLDAGSGKTVWQSDPVARPQRYPSRYTPTLVATPEVVLITGGEASAASTWSTKGAKDTITALDSSTGKTLWAAHHPDSGYASPEDVFVIDGKVWFGDSRDGAQPGNTFGLDLMTGQVKVKFPPDRDIYFFHHRCYRGKATVNWLLTSRAGIEFIDFRKEHWEMNHWIRGACLYGITPANGLIYAPQHPCACYMESKMDGFNAVAPAGQGPRLPLALPPRLEKGPAYGTEPGQTTVKQGDWPVFRHDSQRSGSSAIALTGALEPAYTIEVGGKLSSPVVGNGLLIAAAIDRHTVHAYSAETGDARWTFTAGGRVDSPPTIYGQLVLFGCRDGCIYCLRADDGALVWRFRAAPLQDRIVAYEQLESVWPVHGSVLIRDGVLYAVAGRSTFLDGGLRLVRLAPETGGLLSETVLDGHAKIDGKDLQDYTSWLNMPVAKPDILSSVGDFIYMRSQPFRPDGTRLPPVAKPWSGSADNGAPKPTQDAAHSHLFSPTGFLDDTGWHRTYWLYGSDFYSGWNGYFTAGKVTPAGKIMVFDDKNVYGFGRLPQYWRWTTPMEFQFFAAARDKVGQLRNKPPRRTGQATSPSSGNLSGYLWTKRYPVLARAMCKAGDTIYVAGPEDVLEETNRMDPLNAQEQVEHWEGKHGSVLLAISAIDGTQKATTRLNAVPAFDGLITAQGRLYLTSTDGKILCLGPAN